MGPMYHIQGNTCEDVGETDKQLVHASACVCRDIEHTGSLESTKTLAS